MPVEHRQGGGDDGQGLCGGVGGRGRAGGGAEIIADEWSGAVGVGGGRGYGACQERTPRKALMNNTRNESE